ncbi:DUF5675 family protein [Flammeovirga kamogawensis]|uniref:SH3 domain-containing protein n=1 Tax=Flammeovirga kamogawensis TaxID=373891 RepID=A0ABX8GZY7_9BACT|nr:DUF5675 family protein [Flammeovirga kamogawensis]MBB6459382.1 uncharacterized protein YgiM (DUF1202 family) [Flammeovirga kamogawensis]QWG08939.1 SH3 domain-containing protein [Flammeovirga kamogawensis]TRX67230.1 SH3 domain-containing protein [Flammeovirga kamogawensis]
MKALLFRNQYQFAETLGKLTITDDSGIEVFSCDTLELPWKENKNRISCIPEGIYKAVFRDFGAYANRAFHIQQKNGKEVEGRTGILIHSGNFFTDTRGCILVGKGYADIELKTKRKHIKKDGILDILRSRKTMDELLNLCSEFEIEITSKHKEEKLLFEDDLTLEVENMLSPLKVGDHAFVNVKSKLNLRKGPSTSESIIKTLEDNEEIIVKGLLNEWVEVQTIGLSGWVSDKYITKNGCVGKVKLKNGHLNIREKPNLSSEKLVNNGLNNNETVEITEIKEGWLKVNCRNEIGYVYQEFLKK